MVLILDFRRGTLEKKRGPFKISLAWVSVGAKRPLQEQAYTYLRFVKRKVENAQAFV